jgi:uncharacterized membrane protein YdbT with pleckstrin-like domain
MKLFEPGTNETTIAIFRKHPFFLWLSAAGYVALAIIPLIAWPYINGMGINIGEYASILYFAYLIVLWIMFFIGWTNFMLDTWILTSQRLVDVEQLSLFSRQVSTLSLDRIQDITIREIGFLDTFLGIGTVFIQTAGAEKEFKIVGMKNPVHVKDLIMQTYQSGKNELFQQIRENS